MKYRLLLISTMMLFGMLVFGQQPPNPGFEDWEDVGTVVDEPVDWSSIKTSDGGEIINNAAPQVWEKSTDARSGNYSVRLENKPQFGIIANGTVTCGRIHVHIPIDPALSKSYTVIGDDRWSEPFPHRPDSMVGYYKFYPQDDDVCQIKALLHVSEGSIPAFGTEDNEVGLATFISENKTFDEWTRFSVPFVYYDERIPEYLMMICNIEEANEAYEGSVVFYDDLEFIYNQSSIDDQESLASQIYLHDGVMHLEKLPVDLIKNAQLKLTSINGLEVFQTQITSATVSLRTLEIAPGVYIATLISGDRVIRKKIYLN
jgi:hypothetical protein